MWLKIARSMSTATIARQMHISERSVRRYLTHFQQIGDVVPRTQCCGPNRLLGDLEQMVLLPLILEFTLQEQLHDLFRVTVSAPTIIM